MGSSEVSSLITVKIAVCDDEFLVCNQISTALLDYAHERGCAFDISVFHSGVEVLAGISSDTQVVFLDISMEGLSGMEVARKLREQPSFSEMRIVFVTSMVQYAVEGYSVHAFGFLPKPISRVTFNLLLDDLMRSIAISTGHSVALKTASGVELVKSRDILYVESFAHSMRVVCVGGELSCNAPMGSFEEKLSDGSFFRCHRCYLVGMRHISSISDGFCILSNQDSIPISRYRRREFLEAFNRFVRTWL